MPLETARIIANGTAELIPRYDAAIISPIEALEQKAGNCFTRAITTMAIDLSLDISALLWVA
jgi:hypothetical protein